MTIRDAGDAAMLLELEPTIDAGVNARAMAIAAAVRARRLAGIRDVISTFRSVAVYFDPLRVDADVVRVALDRATGESAPIAEGRTRDIPVAYGGVFGPDLSAVAERARLTEAEVIRLHAQRSYRVFMLGFQPGFAYLGEVDERISVARHATPRVRVAAGSVGIAGVLTGIYPRESPGGWHIIGRTPLRLFDTDREPPALMAPGDTVRFVPADAQTLFDGAAPAAGPERPSHGPAGRHVTVITPGLFTTVQDEGRWGHLADGVAVSGALDRIAHRAANALVGNARSAATLEVTLAGLEVRVEQPTRVGVAGADLSASLDGVAVMPPHVASVKAGAILRFAARRAGARAYVAFDGGIDTAPAMGSRSTHVGYDLGGITGRALRPGDRLPLGNASSRRSPAVRLTLPLPTGGARLRVLPGPQNDCFPEDAFDVLQGSRYTVAPQSNRMGYRLAGGERIPSRSFPVMMSDATFDGAVQVPGSGEPILLLADRHTTGGYPQIATVITADLPLAGQLAPGDWVEFRVCTRAEAIAALVAQEGKLLAVGG